MKSEQVLNMYNRARMESTGKCRVQLVNPKNNEQYEIEFTAVEEECTLLLGSKAVQQMNLIEIRYENIAALQIEGKITGLIMQLIEIDYNNVFIGEGQFEKKLHLEVDPTVQPVKQPLCRMPIAIEQKLKDELTRLEKLGVVKAVDTPTDWVSSLVVVKNPNGKVRMYIDPTPSTKH